MTIPAPVASAFSALLRLPPPPDPPPGDEASAVVFRASRKYLAYRTTGWAIAAAALLIAASVPLLLGLAGNFPRPSDASLLRLGGLGLLAGAVILLALTWIVLRLDYAWRWYVVTDRSLRIREGVWQVREMTVTFANVQNISVEQGPLQRLFGISDVRVDTAGGGGSAAATSHRGRPGTMLNLHTAWLRGLDNAGEVRGAIQQRLRGRLDAGLGDPEDPDSATRPPREKLSPEMVWGAAEVLAEARSLRTVAQQLAGASASQPAPYSPRPSLPNQPT